MARWKKVLQAMLHDTNPRNYTYEDAALVLFHGLGFAEPPRSDGSYRRWRRRLPNGTVVVVGLVNKGHGTLKPGYIRDLVKAVRDHGLVDGDDR